MAKVFQCDRCKGFEKNEVHRRDASRTAHKYTVMVDDVADDEATSHRVELCGACSGNIMTWLKEMPPMAEASK